VIAEAAAITMFSAPDMAGRFEHRASKAHAPAMKLDRKLL
jgi:hypothetical protein